MICFIHTEYKYKTIKVWFYRQTCSTFTSWPVTRFHFWVHFGNNGRQTVRSQRVPYATEIWYCKKYNSYSGSIPLTVFGNKFCLKKRKEIHREPDTLIKMRSFILFFFFLHSLAKLSRREAIIIAELLLLIAFIRYTKLLNIWIHSICCQTKDTRKTVTYTMTVKHLLILAS